MTPFPIEPPRALGPMRIIISAYPSRENALRAVRGALRRRLVACASVLAVDSQYWWHGRVESASEMLVLFKTVPKRVGNLFHYLRGSHPYEVPEIVELDVPRVEPGYLAYLLGTLDPATLGPPVGRRAKRPAVRRGPGAPVPGRTRARRRRPSR